MKKTILFIGSIVMILALAACGSAPQEVVDQLTGGQETAEQDPVEEAFLKFIREERESIWQEITDSRQLDDKTAAQLDQALAEFQKIYAQQKEGATATV